MSQATAPVRSGKPSKEAGPPRVRANLGARRWLSIGGMALLLAVVGFLMFYPALMLAYGSVRTGSPGMGGEFTTDALRTVFSEPQTYLVWMNSVVLSATMTTTSLLVALFLAWVATRTNTPGRQAIFPIMVIAMGMPPLFFATGWSMLGNPRAGLLNQLLMSAFGLETAPLNIESWPGLILVLTLGWSPFAFLLCYGAFATMDRSLEEASLISGAGRVRSFFLVVIPALAPAILGVAILSFVRGLQFFDVPLLIGNPAGIQVFSTHIYDYLQNFVPARYAEASSLSMVLLVTLALLLLLQWRLLGNRKFTTIGGKGHRRALWDIGRWKWVCTGFIVVYTLLALVLPFAQLVIGSLQVTYGVYGGRLSLDNYVAALDRTMVRDGLVNTFVISVGGGLFVVVLCSLIAYVTIRARVPGKRLLEFMTWVPWAMPGVVLGLSMLWAYLSVPALAQFYGSRLLLILALSVAAIPLGIRIMSGAIHQVSFELEEAARVHGASWPRMFAGVVLRLIAPSFVAGWVVVALSISGDLAIPILLYTPGNEVVSVAILALFQSAEASQAAAVFVLMIFIVIGLLLLAAISRRIGARLLHVRSDRRRAAENSPDQSDESGAAVGAASERGARWWATGRDR